VLILTGVQTPESHRTAIRRGAMGIVLKQQAADLLLKAIRKVHEGEVWIDRSMIGTVLSEVRSERREEEKPEVIKMKALTAREREVIAPRVRRFEEQGYRRTFVHQRDHRHTSPKLNLL
jgi:DNA-binding NarL/FixJ family response regulator